LKKSQDKRKADLARFTDRLAKLDEQLKAMPDAALLKHQAMAIRLQLLKKVQDRDWRKLSHEEIRGFLIFLFGENPDKTGSGIRVFREKGRWRITFKGNVEFHHELANGRAIWHGLGKAAAAFNKEAAQFVALTRHT
jgi:hypothetical protein